MSSLDKILSIAGVGSTIANAALLRRFLAGVMLAIILAAMSGTMLGALFIAVFYGVYFALVANGVHSLTAASIVVGTIVALTVFTTVFAWFRWRRLREMSRHLESPGSIVSKVTRLADSFLDGLLKPRHE
jgi:hypothetical protein